MCTCSSTNNYNVFYEHNAFNIIMNLKIQRNAYLTVDRHTTTCESSHPQCGDVLVFIPKCYFTFTYIYPDQNKEIFKLVVKYKRPFGWSKSPGQRRENILTRPRGSHQQNIIFQVLNLSHNMSDNYENVHYLRHFNWYQTWEGKKTVDA